MYSSGAKRPREDRVGEGSAQLKAARWSAGGVLQPVPHNVWSTPAAKLALLQPASPFAVSALRSVRTGPSYGGARSFNRSYALAGADAPRRSRQPQTAPRPSALLPAYADGYWTMSTVPQTVVQPPRTSGAASGAAPSLVPSASTTVASMHATPLPRAPAPAYGFGGSLSLAQMTRPTERQAYMDLFRLRRPDAAPPVTRQLAADAPHAAASESSSAALAAEAKRVATASHAAELDAGAKARDLHLHSSALLEDAPASSRISEIELLEEHMKRLSESRPSAVKPKPAPTPVPDTGLTPLTDEQTALVGASLAAGAPGEVLVSGTFKAMGELDITRHNFECMRDGKWLNDELINFYLGLLQLRELGLNAKKPRVHFHNTFFYNKLYADNRDYSYKAVARWTSEKKLGYSILDCDLVVVPVHQDVHWVLAVCDLQQHEIRYYDSLGGVDQSCLANLARYIADEAQHKRQETLDVSAWPLLAPSDIPEQKNGCDCGVFMLKYADWLARQAPFSFSQRDMAYFRKRIVAEVRQKLAV